MTVSCFEAIDRKTAMMGVLAVHKPVYNAGLTILGQQTSFISCAAQGQASSISFYTFVHSLYRATQKA